MEDGDLYLRLCIRQYAAQQDIDEYVRDRLLKNANQKPHRAWWPYLNPVVLFGWALSRFAK
jgi:hypothetical protein